jgi:GTPase SAR1 family protein
VEAAQRFQSYVINDFEVDGKVNAVNLCDTESGDQFSRFRALNFEEADVFLILFSVVNKSSFENISFQWYEEICFVKADTPIILVGTNVDKRNPNDKNHIKTGQGEMLAAEINATKYMEVTSNDAISIRQVIEDVVRLYRVNPNKKPIEKEFKTPVKQHMRKKSRSFSNNSSPLSNSFGICQSAKNANKLFR